MRAADFSLIVKQKMQYHSDFTTFLYSQRTMHRPNRKTLLSNKVWPRISVTAQIMPLQLKLGKLQNIELFFETVAQVLICF